MTLNRRELLLAVAAAAYAGTGLDSKKRIERVLDTKDVDRPPFSAWHHFHLESQPPEVFAKATIEFHQQTGTDLAKVMSDFPYPDGVITGTYGNTKYGYHDFEARPHVKVAVSETKAPNIGGVWTIPNESPKGEHAWRLIVQQQGAHASAAILRVDGDTGALVGDFSNGTWVLNHFDGARASIAEITPKDDGSLDVEFRGFHAPAKRFSALRADEAKAKGVPEPTDPDEHTRVKDASEPLQFSFPDLNGKLVSNTDEQFRGKVVIVNVTGSWCPNCHDEAPYLVELYHKYHAQGLEIVALDFEEPEQRKDPTRLQAFIKKYGIQYTYLLAGEPSELQAKIPQAVNLNSWPTTFFLGRDGKVRAIHAGFAAPASGEFNTALKKETSERIEKLLSENVRASR